MKKELDAYRKILFIIYMFLIVFFTIMSLESGDDSSEASGSIAKFVSELFGVPNTESFRTLIRKLIGHLGFFGILGLISTAFYQSLDKLDMKYRVILNLGITLVYVFITEFVFQALADSRGPSIKDCLIDYSGFLVGSIIYYGMYFGLLYNNKLSNKASKIYSIIMLIIYILSLILYMFLCYQSGKESSELSKGVSSGVSGIGSAISGTDVTVITPNVNSFVRKLLGHFGYFLMIGFISYLFYLSIPKYKKIFRYLFHFVIGISFAFMTEFVFEKLALGRGPQIKDVFIDSMGFISSTLVLMFAYYTTKYVLQNAKTR